MTPTSPSPRSRWIAAPLALVLLLAANLGTLRAQAPSLAGSPLAFQGYLADGDGVPLAAAAPLNVDVVFRIYDAETGGAVLWSEQQTVTVDKGQYSVLLGNGADFGNEPRPPVASLFIAGDVARRYVEATLKAIGPNGTDATVLPRSRLLPSPYAALALYAAQADRLVNASSSPVLQVTGGAVSLNKAEPAATLDVGGNMAFTGLAVEQDVTVGGVASATAWDGGGVIPVGGIILWSGDTVPEGWALCSGQTVSGVQTPDLRGRFVVSVPNAPWMAAGTETYSHQPSEIPRHRHSARLRGVVTEGADGPHGYRVADSGERNATQDRGLGAANSTLDTVTTSEAGGHSHSFTLPSFISEVAGSGAPRNVMPPFHVLTFIMRVQ